MRITSKQLDLIETGETPHQRAGRTARKAGNRFEQALGDMHKIYQAQCVAMLTPFAMPTRAVVQGVSRAGKSSGQPMRVVTGAAPYDFAGAMGPKTTFPGRHILVEAKSCAKPLKALPISLLRFGLKPKQLIRINVASHTFDAFSLVVWRNESVVGVLTPDLIHKAYVSFRTENKNKIPWSHFIQCPVGSIDYLSVLDVWPEKSIE